MAGNNIVPAAGRSGWVNRTRPPSLDAVQQYNPNVPNFVEGIWQPFYDYQAYAIGGQTQLQFFQVPQGQGGKTLHDTNMTNAGMFPNPTAFFCTGVMIDFQPGNVVSATAAATRVQANANDVVAVANSGWLELQIGSKVYLTDAPLGKFPTNFCVAHWGGIALVGPAAAAINQTDTDIAKMQGRYYEITPFLIPPTQNFVVRLNWPTAVGVTIAGRIGVILDGFWFRNSQ